MKIYKSALIFAVVLLLSTASQAAVINGGRGLPHTKAAWVQERTHLSMLMHTRFWGKVSQFTDTQLGLQDAVTVWTVQGLVSMNYGLGKHFGVTLTPIAYQDVHQGQTEEYPWDTFLGLKIGSFGPKANSLNYGFELGARFPTGERHNVIYEDYTAGTIEAGLTALLSYAYDPLYPEDALNVHANLGYWHHNDVGQDLIPKVLHPENNVIHPSQHVNYGLGFTIPTIGFNYGLELYGLWWIQKPPRAAASRENYAYINASVTYKAFRWFHFMVSGDYRLTADVNETTLPQRFPELGTPNYNTWRVNVGAKFVLLPTSIYRTRERDILMQKAESRRELFEQIIRERRETESAEEELERIRDERRKAERELERLRKVLEGREPQSELEELRQSLEPK
ncbi:hypothetical protein JW992_06035 [candidate division KSB1 bacterium]|nr:hypothetical protein [candidate division KSB1 bacterium]